MIEFRRMNRLPPYVFRVVDNLKMEYRRKGEDIIDLGMGNPNIPTPKHIVTKLVEAAKKGPNHRYSASAGITKLREAIAAWYKRRFRVEIDPEKEAIATIGAKEGLSHLVLAVIYYLILTPIAIVMRTFGRDQLRLRFDASARSYWKEHDPAADTARYFRQS